VRDKVTEEIDKVTEKIDNIFNKKESDEKKE